MKKNIVKYKLIYTSIIISILIQIIIPTKILADEEQNVSIKTNKDISDKSVNINIYVSDMKINYFSAYLEYDTNLFEEIKKSDIILNPAIEENEENGLWVKTFNKNANNKLTISENYGDSYLIPDDGLLATIKLTVKENNDLSSIKLKNVALVDENYIDINYKEILLKVEENKKIKISYNSNINDEILKTVEIKEGEKFKIELIPEREGYTFLGWNSDPNGNGNSYLTENEYSIESDLVLYAQWKKNETENPEKPTEPEEPNQPTKPEEPTNPDENQKLYVKSNIYKILDTYISNILGKTKVTEYIKGINTNGKIKILKQDQNEASQDEYVGTGMILSITKDEENIQLKIVVTGDLDGNGNVTITDLSILNKVMLDIKKLEGAYLKAADMDENDKITITDLSVINKLLVE